MVYLVRREDAFNLTQICKSACYCCGRKCRLRVCVCMSRLIVRGELMFKKETTASACCIMGESVNILGHS